MHPAMPTRAGRRAAPEQHLLARAVQCSMGDTSASALRPSLTKMRWTGKRPPVKNELLARSPAASGDAASPQYLQTEERVRREGGLWVCARWPERHARLADAERNCL